MRQVKCYSNGTHLFCRLLELVVTALLGVEVREGRVLEGFATLCAFNALAMHRYAKFE
jgi:hypothetical protein